MTLVNSPGSALQTLLSALERAGKTWHNQAGGVMAQCPAHDDRTPSLSIDEKSGKVVMYCHAQCDVVDILAAIGLTYPDLFDHPLPEKTRRSVRATMREFPYRNAAGELTGIATRQPDRPDGKRPFLPLKPNPDGSWSLGASEELKATPYRLPELVAAIARGETIWVAEGERDVNTLMDRCGVAATSNQGGAGKWGPAHAYWLRGADVVICQDRDTLKGKATSKAGERHSEAVIATLVGIAASVRIVEPAPPHKDVTDLICAGGALSDLLAVPITQPNPGVADNVVSLRGAPETNGQVAPDDTAGLEADLDSDAAAERERLWQLALASKVRELRLLDEAREVLRTEKDAATHDATNRMVDGGTFIYDAPDHVPAAWGKGDEVLWSMGEPLLITGPTGTGKTTLGGQVVAGRMGLIPKVLGYSVTPGRRVLYLAMDRPNQISRALARLLRQFPRDELADKILFWRGPPPRDLAAHPGALLEMAQRAEADTVVLDSLKDAAVNLSDETVGQGISRAMQLCIAADIEVMGYHHQTKRGNGGISKPNSLADVYGSNWITAGVGSVLLIWGDAGDPIVELSHLKQPAGEVGPLTLAHDMAAGTMAIVEGGDVLDLLLSAPRTAAEIATALYGASSPSKAQVEKARRKLTKLISAGLAVQLGDWSKGGTSDGRKGGGEGARYGAATRAGSIHDRSTKTPYRSTVSEFPQVDRSTVQNGQDRSTISIHDRSTPIHEKDITAGESIHASIHARTGQDRSTPAASPVKGEAGDQRGDLEPVRGTTNLDASGDQWLHCHLTITPQPVTRLAADLDATDAAVEAALDRLARSGHAQHHPQSDSPDGWSLPWKEPR